MLNLCIFKFKSFSVLYYNMFCVQLPVIAIHLPTEPSSSSYPFNMDNMYSSGHYILCDDLYSESTVFNLSGAQNILIDCQEHEVRNKLGCTPDLSTYDFITSNSRNINLINCNVNSQSSTFDTSCLPYGSVSRAYGYSLLLTGSSDNITVKDSNITWKVKIDNSGENEFENVRFEYEGTSNYWFDMADESINRFNNCNLTSPMRVRVWDSATSTFTNSVLNTNFELRDLSQSLFINSNYKGPIIELHSNSHNNLSIENLKPVSNLNSEVKSLNTSFKVKFENTDITSDNNPFRVYIENGQSKIKNSDLLNLHLKNISYNELYNSYINHTALVDKSQLITYGDVNISKVSFGDSYSNSIDSLFSGVWITNNLTIENSNKNNFTVTVFVYNHVTSSSSAVDNGIVEYKELNCDDIGCHNETKHCKFDESYHGWVALHYNFTQVSSDNDINSYVKTVDITRIDNPDEYDYPWCDKLPEGLGGGTLCPEWTDEYCNPSIPSWSEYPIYSSVMTD